MDSEIKAGMEREGHDDALSELGDKFLYIKEDLLDLGYDEEDIHEFIFDYLKDLEL